MRGMGKAHVKERAELTRLNYNCATRAHPSQTVDPAFGTNFPAAQSVHMDSACA